jgi:hypothetical protein
MKIKVYILLIASLLLSSCTTKLLYNYADWALEWYVQDLVTLNDDQEWKLHDAVDSLLAWHRKNQIPFYIETLSEIEKAVESQITLEFLKRFYFAHEKGWMELKYRATPTLTGLLNTLTASQVVELKENMLDQENKLREKYLNKPAEQLAKERTERMIERIEDWVGDLDKKQRQLVYNWSNQVKLVSDQWAYSREQWQTHFIKIVRESRHKKDFPSLMMEHFQNSRKYWPEGYEAAYYYNVDLTLKMMADIGNQLTKNQRKKLLDKVTDLKKQLIEIYEED